MSSFLMTLTLGSRLTVPIAPVFNDFYHTGFPLNGVLELSVVCPRHKTGLAFGSITATTQPTQRRY